MDVNAARAEYRSLRASCQRHDARRFDDVARRIAYELSDGEDITPSHYLQAARIICSGFDCA